MTDTPLRPDVLRATEPQRILLLSLVSLLVPVASAAFFPEWSNDEIGMLVWVLALVPAFLLSYHRGWRGSSLALAGAMAAFALGQAIVLWKGSAPPPAEVILGAVVVLLAVALGTGWLASTFRASIRTTEEMALTDPGTRLPNRRHATLHLDRAFEAARRGVPLSVVAFDLDHFKSINDRFGHATGDRVLREFADILNGLTRRSGLSARLGGEEFVSILDGIPAEGAEVYANRVLDRLREHPFAWGTVTASAGIAEYESGMASPDVIMAAADQALYRAKQSGRDRVTVIGRLGRREIGAPPAAVPSFQRTPAHDRGNGERILVVDDEPAVLRTVARALHRLGYAPLEAADPERALEITRGLQEPLDLVITDLVMPSMSGFRLVEVLREQRQEIRVIYMSGYDDTDVDWAGVPGDVRMFLQKPIELSVLAATIRQALDAPVPVRRAPSTAVNASQPMPDDVDPIASAIELRAQLTAHAALLEEAHSDLVLRLARAAEYRDDSTGQHAQRVGILAGMLAEQMGVSEPLRGLIAGAAPLHDVGKIAIPDAILHKPGALTSTERELMMMHTQLGADLLSGSRHPLMREAQRVALSHHEWWNGAGYPQGLKAQEIPLSARIVAVADAFDSLTHDRPYRQAVSVTETIAILVRDRGIQFDPDALDALLALVEGGLIRRVAETHMVAWPDTRSARDQA